MFVYCLGLSDVFCWDEVDDSSGELEYLDGSVSMGDGCDFDFVFGG